MENSNKVQFCQQITLKAEIVEGQTEELVLRDCRDNSDYIEVGDGAEVINIHKDMIDSLIRALAKFNL